jgi:hypothetical protein
MKSFTCTSCSNSIYFENVQCVTCKHALAFDPAAIAMVALQPATAGHYRTLGGGRVRNVVYCANAAHGACNWLTPVDDATGLCIACDLNRTIPNLSEPGNLAAWQELEAAKKRLVYAILRLGLPVAAGAPGQESRLIFDFIKKATTGHENGVITMDIAEADPVEREKQKSRFGEPYRSLLGHLRHESGHFYWMRLVEGSGRIDHFRRLFGDERHSYADALARHHSAGPPADWQMHHVSAYASMHPFEDWAETWAHYLHMLDTLDTADAVGLEPRAAGFKLGALWPFKSSDVYRDETFAALLDRWVPLTLAMNSLSRSMGHPDFYPFVISPIARDKLAFVHGVVRDCAVQPASGSLPTLSAAAR